MKKKNFKERITAQNSSNQSNGRVNANTSNEFQDLLNKFWDIALNNPKNGVCCICGKPYNNHGNNARPFKDGRCCDECDKKYVRPYRLTHYMEYQEEVCRSRKVLLGNLVKNIN